MYLFIEEMFKEHINTFYQQLYHEQINIESLMSCHLLLNLLHELANIISLLPTNVINLVINDNEFEILFIT